VILDLRFLIWDGQEISDLKSGVFIFIQSKI